MTDQRHANVTDQRSAFAPVTTVRLIVGWVAAALTLVFRSWLQDDLPGPLAILVLVAVVAVIIFCSFGVATQAEALARLLGDPYGTLILSVSIALIEVVLIAAIMFGPGEHPTISRDSIMAVSMIIMNLVVGIAILIEVHKNTGQAANRRGFFVYLGFLSTFLAVSFWLPNLIGEGGAFSPSQQKVVIVVVALGYILFLGLQTGPLTSTFQEVHMPASAPKERQKQSGQTTIDPLDNAIRGDDDAKPGSAPETKPGCAARTVRLVATRTGLLVALMIPVVILADDMAYQLNRAVTAVRAPVALSGMLIAMIVFLPETITTFKAAAGHESQRVSNLTHGALLSTLGITIPSVLALGLITGKQVVLGESALNLVFLAVTLAVTAVSYTAKRFRSAHGWAHVALFAGYLAALFVT